MTYPGILQFRLRIQPGEEPYPCLDIQTTWPAGEPVPRSAVLLQLRETRLEWFKLDQVFIDEEATRNFIEKIQRQRLLTLTPSNQQ